MNNWRGDMLATASVLLLGGTIWALFYGSIPPDSKDVLLVVIGALVGVVKDVFSFEFSTSKSGERSAQAVVRIAEGSPTSTAVAVATKRTDTKPPDVVEAPKTIVAQDVQVKAAGDVTVEKA